MSAVLAWFVWSMVVALGRIAARGSHGPRLTFSVEIGRFSALQFGLRASGLSVWTWARRPDASDTRDPDDCPDRCLTWRGCGLIGPALILDRTPRRGLPAS